jgi:acetyl/propionyl-CoA carboxylase alpha subunit
VDSAVREGDEVTSHYDPMLAKIIAWGPDRPATLARMERALEDTVVLGLCTNRDYLLAAVRHPAMRSGDLSTHFVDEHLADWSAPEQLPDEVLALAAMAREGGRNAVATTGASREPGPWTRLGAWRLSGER